MPSKPWKNFKFSFFIVRFSSMVTNELMYHLTWRISVKEHNVIERCRYGVCNGVARGIAATMGFQNICDVMFLPCDRFSRVCWIQRATRRRSKSWRRSNRNARKRANPEMRVTIIHSNQKLHVLAVKSCHWNWIRRERTVCALVWMLSGRNFQPAKMARYFFYWSSPVSSDNKIE